MRLLGFLANDVLKRYTSIFRSQLAFSDFFFKMCYHGKDYSNSFRSAPCKQAFVRELCQCYRARPHPYPEGEDMCYQKVGIWRQSYLVEMLSDDRGCMECSEGSNL